MYAPSLLVCIHVHTEVQSVMCPSGDSVRRVMYLTALVFRCIQDVFLETFGLHLLRGVQYVSRDQSRLCEQEIVILLTRNYVCSVVVQH
jgi:hypothetical protein